MAKHRRLYWTQWVVIVNLLLATSPSLALTEGDKAPNFVAEDLSGNPFHLSDVGPNQIVILYFWDVQFEICHQGLKVLQKYQAQYPQELTILAVNINPEAREELNQFRHNNPWGGGRGKWLLNTGEAAQHYDAEFSVPVSCIIDQNGYVAFYEQSFDEERLKRQLKRLIKPRSWKGLWGQYLLTIDDPNNLEIFHWGRGDVLSLGYLREGRTHWTFALQGAFSYQKPTEYESERSLLMSEVASGSLTLSIGPPPLWRRFGITLMGGAAGYERLSDVVDSENGERVQIPSQEPSTHIVPVAGLGAKIYIANQVTLYASGGVDLDAATKAFNNGGSLLQEENLYRYEAGIQAYLIRDLNLKIGYGLWRLGDRDVKGLQIASGYIF